MPGKHDTSVKDLLRLNPRISDPDKIYSGQVLAVPVSSSDILETIAVEPGVVEVNETVETVDVPLPDVMPVLEDADTLPSNFRSIEPAYIADDVDEQPERKKSKRSKKTGSRDVIGVEVSYWMTHVDARFQSSTEKKKGTVIDLEDDLGVDSSNSIPVYSLWFQPLSFLRTRFSMMTIDLEGHKSIEETIKFSGHKFESFRRCYR